MTVIMQVMALNRADETTSCRSDAN